MEEVASGVQIQVVALPLTGLLVVEAVVVLPQWLMSETKQRHLEVEASVAWPAPE